MGRCPTVSPPARLAYLLQHQDNPVDWRPWGDEAFAEARERDVPVLLSIGYAACHWCHVMAHESFEDAEVAAYLNEHFVPVKVDREERPDVDAVLHGGDHGADRSRRLADDGVRDAGRGSRSSAAPTSRRRRGTACRRSASCCVGGADLGRAPRRGAWPRASASSRALAERRHGAPATAAAPTPAGSTRRCGPLRRTYDEGAAASAAHRSSRRRWCWSCCCATTRAPGMRTRCGWSRTPARRWPAAASTTSSAGGFARYSVDAGWVVPHFEKMLYDNALLLRVYTALVARDRVAAGPTGGPGDRRLDAPRAARPPRAASPRRSTPTPTASRALTYVWTPAQLVEVLGPDDGAWAAGLLQVTPTGTFEHGASTLQLLLDPDDEARWDRVRRCACSRLATRAPQPARDDKVVAAWNGLAIAALAETGALLDRPDLVAAAAAPPTCCCGVHVVGGRLRRVSRDGAVGAPRGVLEDYADVAEGLLALFAVTGDARWLGPRRRTARRRARRGSSDGRGGFFDTADDARRGAVGARRRRTRPTTPTPAGLVGRRRRPARLCGLHRLGPHREAAEAALGVYAPARPAHARFAGWGLAVAEALVDGPREVAVVGAAGDPATRAMQSVALRGTAPGAAVAVGDPRRGPGGRRGTLLDHRPLVGGRPAAYVCRHFTCAAPTDRRRRRHRGWRAARSVGRRSAHR